MKGVPSELLSRYTRVCAQSLNLDQVLDLPVGLREQEFFSLAEGTLEAAVQSAAINAMDMLLVDRWLEIRQLTSLFLRLMQMTLERRSVSGALYLSYCPAAIAQATERSRCFHEFDVPFDLATIEPRAALKLLSLTNGETTFLVAQGRAVLGIAELHRPMRFSGSSSITELPTTMREWELATALSIDRSDVLILRALGGGSGAVYNSGRRVVDIRQGRYCYESSIAPIHAVRNALRAAGCDWNTLSTVEAAIERLRVRSKGAMFVVSPDARHFDAISGNVRVRLTSRRATASMRAFRQAHISESDARTLANFAALDGAVCLTANGQLWSVGDILASPHCGTERFDHGARHNTARRISSAVDGSTVVTVSEDGFVSPFRAGLLVIVSEPCFTPAELEARQRNLEIFLPPKNSDPD